VEQAKLFRPIILAATFWPTFTRSINHSIVSTYWFPVSRGRQSHHWARGIFASPSTLYG